MKKIIVFAFAILAIANLSFSQSYDHFPGELLVQMQKGQDVERLVQRLAKFDGRPTGLRAVKEVSPPFRIWLLEFDASAFDDDDMLGLLRRQHDVAIAQFNHVISRRDTLPDDPIFPSQWQWLNTGQNGGTPDSDVDADEAWDITTGGQTASGDEIVVCVLEGTNRNHPDLQGNLWFNNSEIPDNGIDDDGNGYVDDYEGWNVQTNTDDINAEGHGTTVAGMIGAVGNNYLLATGINWNVKIMNVDFSGVSEANALASYTYPYVMRKLYNETGGARGAFVVATNASWGLDNGQPADAPLWCAFYDSLGTVGILNCGATANNNVNIDQVGDLPTACPSEYMIAVTATNSDDIRTFSGYGVEHIDVGAPGQAIVSINLNGGPTTTSGTSFASPLVAGMIGLMYSAPCPYLGSMAKSSPATAAQLVRDAIFNSVDTVPALLDEVKYGGRVNVKKAIDLLLENCGPCPSPFGPMAAEVVDTSAYISWVSYDSALYTQLRYRLIGDTVWTVIDTANSPQFLDDLQACAAYEAELIDFCADTSSVAAQLTFMTDGCCVPPSGLAYDNLTDSTVTISWNSVLAAQAYQVTLIANGDTSLLDDVQQTSLDLAGLEPCTEYLVQVQTVCDTGTTVDLVEIMFKTSGCGPCTDLNYCPSASANASEEWISNVSIGDLDNSSASNGGYSDFTGISTTLSTYQIYPMEVTPAYAGGTFPEWIKAWIDFNQDGLFGNDEVVLNSGDLTTTTVSGNVAIPPTALPGITRMRVSMRWNAEPDACLESFNFGEVEDYCVVIEEGTPPDCDPPTDLTTSAIDYTSATPQWGSTANGLDYSLEYRSIGSANWTSLQVNGTSQALNNLEDCTDYEFRVKAGCGFVESDWSVTDTFTTLCYPPCDVVPNGLDTSSVSMNGATLSWNAVADAENYVVSYQIDGDSAVTYLNSSTNSIIISNLDSCTTYLFAVQALCPGDGSSAFSIPFAFMTQCANAASEQIPGLTAVSVSPNPFDDFLRVNLTLESAMDLEANLTTLDGKVLHQFSRSFSTGTAIWQLNGWDELPSGVYVLRLRANAGVMGVRVVKR
ncbi:MAG: hypothetical protein CMN32_10510 [Saprospirales bacterium]|nr:hypothetical protein [Saprospirales bacterium]